MLSETETFTIPWPLTDEATQAIEGLIGEHLEKVVSREQADRHRDRLLQMVYLTELQGQTAYSNLIATAAWSMSPEREGPLTQNPLLRALMRKNIVHHVVSSEEIHATHHH